MAKQISRVRAAHVRTILGLAAVTAVFEYPQSTVHGANFTWGNTGATFSTGANWLNGTAPSNSATADVGVFLGTPTVQPQMTQTTRSIGGLDFQTAGWTFTGTGELALGSGVGTAGPFTSPVNGIISSTNAVGSINFNNPFRFSNNQTWAASVDVNFNNGLVMDGAGATRSLFFGAAAGTSFAGSVTVNGDADFNSSLTGGAATRLVTFGGLGNVTFNGTVKGSGGPAAGTPGVVSLRMNSSGVLSLLGSNSFTGSFNFSGGTVVIASDAGLGVAPAALVPTQMNATGTSTLALAAGAGSVSLAVTRGLTLTSGTFNIDTGDANNTLVEPAPIVGTGRLFKQGNGTLILSGLNTQTGTLAFVGGVLDVRSDQSTGSGIFRFGGGTLVAGAGPVTIPNATVLLTNASTVAGDQPITFGGTWTYDGSSDRSETVSSTALTTINGGLILSSSTGARRFSLNGTGSTTIVGPIAETPGNPGTFILNNIGSTTLASTSNNFTGGFTLGNNSSTVIIAADNAFGSGTFTWIGGTVQSAAPRLIANPILMMPTGTRTIGSPIEFSGPVSLNSTGLATLTPRTVAVNTGVTGTFSGVISDTDGTGFEKAGAGTLVLSASNTYAGGVSFRNGILSVSSDANLGAATGSLSFDGGTLLTTAGIISTRAITTTANGGSIDIGPANSTFGAVTGITPASIFAKYGTGKLTIDSARVSSLIVDAGTVAISSGRSTAKTSIVSGIQLSGGAGSWSSSVDLADQDLIDDYDPTGASPLATLLSQITGGYNNGDWTGKGITSSFAAANASSAHPTALGYGEAATLSVGSFSGQTVDTSSVLVRYTFSGDANLDGTVDTNDFTLLGQGFNKSGALWTDGDFNFDGTVNALDFNTLAINFGQTLPSPALGSLVPEPAGACVALIATTAMARRRRNAK